MTAVEFLIDNIVAGLFQGPNRPPAIRVDWQNAILGAVRDEKGRGSAEARRRHRARRIGDDVGKEITIG